MNIQYINLINKNPQITLVTGCAHAEPWRCGAGKLPLLIGWPWSEPKLPEYATWFFSMHLAHSQHGETVNIVSLGFYYVCVTWFM